MKLFLTTILAFVALAEAARTGEVSLTPYDDAQYGGLFNDKDNILTVTPEEYRPGRKQEPKPTSSESYLDPQFKAVLQDLSDNSHLVSLESKDDSRFLSRSADYERRIDESVNSEMEEIARESREEGLRAQSQEMAGDLSMPVATGRKAGNGLLKAPRFLEKARTESEDNEDESQIYDPSEA